ncbi:T9SS type A sorting domain-containing protein [Flammeovirga pacifica]|uniref:Secretion system C-terminal sorting domain-containing protein n=1 Tax=Flammeovirga pacifica TaxID=915059 RepID=A0A1S1YUR0_FLAPC|nr:T9SS type A sorting domain-containing protein [Flammeovirga pacifica]OHX64603.1 hypothetical protein NH26_23825 [Flammeovirga pacifica]
MRNLPLLILCVIFLQSCVSNEEHLGDFVPIINLESDYIIIKYDSVHPGNFANTRIKIINNSKLTFKGGDMDRVEFDIEAGSSLSLTHNPVRLHNVKINLNNAKGLCTESNNARVIINDKTYDNVKRGCYGVEDLPVTIISFKSIKKGKNIELKWSTATEENNELFEIERSLDMMNWETVAQIKGAGNSNTKVNYQFLDEDVPSVSGVVYHRLKQIDFDQKWEYIGPVGVKMGSASEENVVVYPNPISFGENLKVVSTYHHMNVKIFDSSGRTYFDETILSNLAQIPMNYGKGVLFVEVKNGTTSSTHKILVL